MTNKTREPSNDRSGRGIHAYIYIYIYIIHLLCFGIAAWYSEPTLCWTLCIKTITVLIIHVINLCIKYTSLYHFVGSHDVWFDYAIVQNDIDLCFVIR